MVDADNELNAIVGYLDWQRSHIMEALDGMSDEDLRTAHVASGWTPLGMLSHLAYDVELFWFQAVVAGDQDVIASLPEGESWEVADDVTFADLSAAYRALCERSNAVLQSVHGDDAPAWWPVELFGDFRLDTVRQVVLHVLTETSVHAGHLDIVRENLDGKQWMVMS